MPGEKLPFGEDQEPTISDADIEALFSAESLRDDIKNAAKAIEFLLDFAEAGDKRLRATSEEEGHTFSRQFLLESGGNAKYPFNHSRVQGKRKREFDDMPARSITIRVPDGATDVDNSPSYVVALLTRYDNSGVPITHHVLTKDGYAKWDETISEKDRFIVEDGVITGVNGVVYEALNSWQFEAEMYTYEPMTQSTSTDEAA